MDCLRKLETVLIKETLFLVHFAVSFQRIEYYRSRKKNASTMSPECGEFHMGYVRDMM